MNELIIVESPTKARIIKKFLGKNYDVISSMGHLIDLPENRFGVNIEKNFEPEYEIIKGKNKIINQIKKSVKNSEKIYLAMDEDREGEAIGWHLLNAIDKDENKDNVDRIVFHEVTQEAIEDALKNPRKINMNLVYAQQARRILDRIVGYKLSPLLSKRIRKGLSAGRVQSVGLKIIVVRERERQAFKVIKYYTVEGLALKDSDVLKVDLWGKNNKKFPKYYLEKKEKADEIISEVIKQKLRIDNIEEKEKKNNPLPPFITSTLQQEAYNRLGMNPEKTMRLAQQLYEGVDLPDGTSTGLITYMRTDSVNIANSAVKKVRSLIKKDFGNEYLPDKPNKYKSKKSAQEAHECVRPTDAALVPEGLSSSLSPGQFKLYRMIWDRFVSSQMTPARIKQVALEISSGDYNFRATGQQLLFDGYTKVWKTSLNEVLLPALSIADELEWKELKSVEHETKPPARYTPATLIKELEKNGIGRPSTYATILRTLLKRNYIALQNGSLVPQEISFIVIDELEKHFQRIMDNTFTAKMEENLDQVASGDFNWQSMMKEFYGPFNSHYDNALKNMDKIKDEETDIKCPKCASPMVIKWGRNGRFFACSAFPRCKQTYTMDSDGKIIRDEDTNIKCPKCQSPMVMKMGRYGKFLSCSTYPRCRQTFAVDEDGKPIIPPIPKCSQCGQDTVIRVGRRGKFIACSGYPKCHFSMSLDEAKKKNS